MPSDAIPPEIRFVGSEDGIALLDVRSGRFFSLNKLGSEIWSALAEGRSLSEIERLLKAKYEVSGETLKVDLTKFVQDLETFRLLRRP